MPNLLTDYLTEHAADFERFRAAYNLERDADPAHFVAAAGRCVRLGEQSPPDLLSFAHGFLSSYHETEDPKRVLAAIIQSQEIPPGSVMARQQPDPHLALVNRFGGNPDRVIRSVLIANNGMAAKRIIDSLRAYAQKYFGNPYAIRIIAMATPEDKALGLSYIREADEVVNVPPDLQQGMGDAANYANVDLIRRIAVATGADAVHPGWGHASEQAELAKAIEEEGLIFMGPSAPLMSAHGDKIRALLMFQKLVGREMMSDWSGSDVAIGDDLEITAEDISKSCVNTVEEAVAASEALGFPVMLKAAGAGGGRGMKECYTEADLRHAWDKVVKQGGGSNIFVERLAVQRKEVTLANARQMADAMGYGKLHLSYLGKNYLINGPEDFDHEDIRKIFDESAYALSWVAEEERLANSTFLLGGGLKHIEVQVIADRHGQVVVLWPRDCSIQRNHQKVVEESAYTNPEIAKKLMRAAATIAKAKVAGESYSGLATVEFLVNEETGKANFLEVNTRVQVEHPVTEEVTDLNFLEIQTLISQGVPLHHIKEVRDYFNADPESRVRVIPDLVTIHERTFPTSPIDFDSVMFDKKPEGHVIALRIIAEDPENFDSSSGTIQKITLPGLRGVTGYYSVREGGGKGSASDAQIGHIFIHGKDRQEAITKALQALDQITVFGQIKTNIPLLKQILKHPEYVAGTAHNASLERWVQEKSVVVEKAEPHLAAISSAMVRAAAEFQRRKEAFLKALSKGQVPSLDLLKTTHRVTSIINGQKYEFMAHLTSPGTISLALMRPDEADAKAGKSPPRLIEDPDFTKHVEGEVTFEPDGAMTLSINNRRFSIHVSLEQNAERMEINGLAARIGFEEMDPTVLTFSAQARVIRIKVKKGEKVTLGQLLLVVEAAKEEKEILSDREGVIELVVSEGQVVSARDPLVRFELPPGEKKKETPYYTGTLNRVSSEVNLMPPAWSRPSLSPDTASDLIDRVMSGHLFPKELKLEEHFTEYFRYLSSRLALGTLLQNFIAERRMGMPGALYEELLAVAGNLRKSNPHDPANVDAVAQLIREKIAAYKTEFIRGEAIYRDIAFKAAFDVFIVSAPVARPLEFYARRLISRYLDAENDFGVRTAAVDPLLPLVVLRNRTAEAFNPASPGDIFRIQRAHGFFTSENRTSEALVQKNRILSTFLDLLGPQAEMVEKLRPWLDALAKLYGPPYQEVAAKARKILMGQVGEQTAEDRQRELADQLGRTNATGLKKLAELPGALFPDLLPLTYGVDQNTAGGETEGSQKLRRNATILYAMRTYKAYPHQFRANPTPATGPVTISFVYRYPDTGQEKFDRFAQVVSFEKLDDLGSLLPGILARYGQTMGEQAEEIESGNATLTLLTSSSRVGLSGDSLSELISGILNEYKDAIRRTGIKRITLGIVTVPGEDPVHFTFKVPLSLERIVEQAMAEARGGTVRVSRDRDNDPIAEDTVYRNLEPPLSYLIDFDLLKNFHLGRVPSMNNRIYLYQGVEKPDPRKADKKAKKGEKPDRRLFVRSIVRQTTVGAGNRFKEIDSTFEESIADLELALADRGAKAPEWNEIYMNILLPVEISLEEMTQYLSDLIRTHKDHLNELKVHRLEFKFALKQGGSPLKQDFRMIVRNFPQTRFTADVYSQNNADKSKIVLTHVEDPSRVIPLEAYPPLDEIEKRRLKAQEMKTTYAYDWPKLIQDALARHFPAATAGARFVRQTELYLTEDQRLAEDTFGKRPIGANIVDPDDPSKNNGAVVFRLNLTTPEYPDGREIILAVVNDVNVSGGSFGVKEAALYTAAARRAIDEGIPFITVQANTGARFGIEEEVAKRFKTAYSFKEKALGHEDLSNLQFDYIYLTEADYEEIKDQVICETVEVGGEVRYKIIDVLGLTESIDADSLRGSGYIAGVSDEAYDKIFTASLVSGYMATGIGSYLARLLHRVLQNGPMGLTGFRALNQMLNAQKYLNNEQTSGKGIMMANGVAHWGIEHDVGGVETLLRLLSFIPKDNASLPPVVETPDPVTRELKLPANEEHKKDPYFYAKELFDADSFIPEPDEFMAGYGKTVIAGRARIGGRAVGFAMPNYDKTKLGRVIPADPGDESSAERTEKQDPRVLYPDSSSKMAEAIENFSRDGLATMLLIDWRGFSAGTRDMHAEVLKFGSMIVSAIRKARQPVYAYIMPDGELRGGSWVVFDEAINGELRVKMYAADTARGGVVEKVMTVGLFAKKTAAPKLKEMLGQVPELKTLYEKLAACDSEKEPVIHAGLKREVERLEKQYTKVFWGLLPTGNFGGMLASGYEALVDGQQKADFLLKRGLIREIIPWKDARKTFAVMIARDYEVLDLEREIKRVYPTIRFRSLSPLLQSYEAYLREKGLGSDPERRAQILADVKKLLAEKYVDEALRANPLASLDALREHLEERYGYAGQEVPEEVRGALEALGTGLAMLPDVPAKITEYLEIVKAVRELGLWRGEESDEDRPYFFDEQGNGYTTQVHRAGELTLYLLTEELGMDEAALKQKWEDLWKIVALKEVFASYTKVIIKGTSFSPIELVRPSTDSVPSGGEGSGSGESCRVRPPTPRPHTVAGELAVRISTSPRGVQVGGTKDETKAMLTMPAGGDALVQGALHVDRNLALAAQPVLTQAAPEPRKDEAGKRKRGDRPWSRLPNGTFGLPRARGARTLRGMNAKVLRGPWGK